eukprot:NODE_528_length_7173_cov_0.249929.p1 type:complete len:435 gc:universal NODE_528_length_7173_cov_0.249929:2898-1594(-)
MLYSTLLFAEIYDDIINAHGDTVQLPRPVEFPDKLSSDFLGRFQSRVNDVKVDVKIKFPNMQLKNVNLDSASWVVDAECTTSTITATVDETAPTVWPSKMFIFIGHHWCVNNLDGSGPWFVATNVAMSGNTVEMDIESAKPEEYADYFEVVAKLVKKSTRSRVLNLDKDFESIQLPFCYDEETHGTCQRNLPMHRDQRTNIVCEDCWAFLNFGFLYKATGRLKKLNRGIKSVINMVAKGEMNFDVRVETRSTVERAWEKYFDATKLISKIIPIINIPDVLQLHPEASLWASAHVKVVKNMDIAFGIEGDVDFELTTASGQAPMKRFVLNLVPHESRVKVLESKGQADVTVTADVSLVFNFLNGLLTDSAGTYLDSTAGIFVDRLSNECPGQLEYQIKKGHEMGLHFHSNKKSLVSQPMENINCPRCSGCLDISA